MRGPLRRVSFGRILGTGRALALLALAAFVSPVRGAEPPTLVAAWALPTSRVGPTLPNALAVDSSGAVYVVEIGANRVLKFESGGALLSIWGGPAGEEDALRKPFGIAVGPDDSVYVTELGGDRVRRYDREGRERRGFGVSGAGPGEFREPRGIASDSKGILYVVDGLNRRIQKFSDSGRFLAAWDGGSGEALRSPVGIAVGSEVVAVTDPGKVASAVVAVTDPGASRVRTFSENGDPLASWGLELPEAAAEPFWPHAVALVGAGTLLVADPFAGEVYSFTAGGDFLGTWSRGESAKGQMALGFILRSDEIPLGASPRSRTLPRRDLLTPIALSFRAGRIDLLDRGLGQVRRSASFPPNRWPADCVGPVGRRGPRTGPQKIDRPGLPVNESGGEGDSTHERAPRRAGWNAAGGRRTEAMS